MAAKGPKGSIGSWFAAYEGQDIPCIHEERLRAGHYHDETLVPGGKRQGPAFVGAIETGHTVLVIRNNVEPAPRRPKRVYVSLAKVGPVTFDRHGLRFDVIETVQSLA